MRYAARVSDPESLLLAALRAAPRRYRMPPLAPEAGPEGALASVIERVRTGEADEAVRELFTQNLSTLIAHAVRGDPVLQAQLLREEQPQVAEYAGLAAQEAADRRHVWTLVDAFAHPGKLRALPEDAAREALARLHALARGRAWEAFRAGAQALPQAHAVLADPALARLERLAALQQDEAVQRYLSLGAAQGPAAGSEAAVQRGRAAARSGEAVEAQTLHAFMMLAHAMGRAYRAAQGLRPTTGFPRAAHGAKDEWDVALLHTHGGVDRIVLLAECKAAPLAAAGDWPRLLAGLRRLSGVEGKASYGFSSSEGALSVSGTSLRALAPHDELPPPNVFYACSAAEQRIPLLAPAARAMLLQEPAAIAFARALAQGTSPSPAQLAPLLDALRREPRLRPVLHQYETARRAREAMLHPDDLLAAADAFAQGRPRNR